MKDKCSSILPEKNDEIQRCTTCGSDNEGADLWGFDDGSELCQECWEAHCAKEFWKYVEAVNL
jgi:hypothetical protein